MAGAFGKNRLTSGFSKPTAGAQRRPKEPADGGSPRSSGSQTGIGEAADSAIEISDDDDIADSEGGIVLNFEDRKSSSNVIAISDEEESGEIKSDDSMDYSPQLGTVGAAAGHSGDEGPSFMIDSVPVGAVKRLSDLTPQQREDQIRYAFYHLERDQIDLGRPVICMKCFDEGHLGEDCAQRTMFPVFKCVPGQQVRVWISCCVCASKDHLVGDCPDIDTSEVKRWSLAHLDPSQIINLSLETGTRKLEKEAENRGMRPTNISIKGRAGRHTAGVRPHDNDESSDDDSVFRNKRVRHDESQQRKYDRFEGPAETANRTRGGWYATDSFGRRRSGSPLQQDSRGPTHGRRSSPPRSDSWRPGGSSSAPDSYRPGQPEAGSRDPRYQPKMSSSSSNNNEGKAAAAKGKPVPTFPQGSNNIRVNLPTRKGSNTWTSDHSSQPEPAAANSHTKHGKRGGGGGGGGKRRRGK